MVFSTRVVRTPFGTRTVPAGCLCSASHAPFHWDFRQTHEAFHCRHLARHAKRMRLSQSSIFTGTYTITSMHALLHELRHTVVDPDLSAVSTTTCAAWSCGHTVVPTLLPVHPHWTLGHLSGDRTESLKDSQGEDYSEHLDQQLLQVDTPDAWLRVGCLKPLRSHLDNVQNSSDDGIVSACFQSKTAAVVWSTCG